MTAWLEVWDSERSTQCVCNYCIPGSADSSLFYEGEPCPGCPEGSLAVREDFPGWLTCTHCELELRDGSELEITEEKKGEPE